MSITMITHNKHGITDIQDKKCKHCLSCMSVGQCYKFGHIIIWTNLLSEKILTLFHNLLMSPICQQGVWSREVQEWVSISHFLPFPQVLFPFPFPSPPNIYSHCQSFSIQFFPFSFPIVSIGTKLCIIYT